MVSRERMLILLVVPVLLIVLCAMPAWSAEGEGGAKQTKGEAAKAKTGADTTIMQDMFGGGVFGIMIMIALFLLSMAAMSLVIEHFISIRRDVLVPDYIAQEVDSLLSTGEVTEALEATEADDSFLAKVVRAGLADMRSGYDAMYESMQAAGEAETTKLHRKIEYLALIGNIAPMLGLFGTVYGMIGAFKTIAIAGTPTPSDMAGGISKALFTTLVGLMIAIPTTAMYTFFQNRVVRISLDVGGIAEELIRRFKPTQ